MLRWEFDYVSSSNQTIRQPKKPLKLAIIRRHSLSEVPMFRMSLRIVYVYVTFVVLRLIWFGCLRLMVFCDVVELVGLLVSSNGRVRPVSSNSLVFVFDAD